MNHSELMKRHMRFWIRVAATAWLVALVLVLSACGGGETDEDAHKDEQPVACQLHPETCK